MTTPDPIGAARRDAARRRLLGPNPACLRCGDSRLDVLDADHVAGRNNDKTLKAALCGNCHRIVTRERRNLGISMDEPETDLARVVAIVGGIGHFLTVLGAALVSAAEFLKRLLDGLDAAFPDWRDQPWAVWE